MDATPGVTKLLLEWQKGDQQALERLMPLVYDELRAIARRYLARERTGHTLQSTALVHEAYLKMVDQQHVEWQNRAQFFGIAATLMRRVLVDHARATHRQKRGGPLPRLSLDEAIDVPKPTTDVDLLVLDEALGRLEAIDQQQCRLVELRFFGGLTIEESAVALGVSTGTVKRDWNSAKAWLFQEMNRPTP
jgi:RNA polymerase sigma factor (TIGR02999 family)